MTIFEKIIAREIPADIDPKAPVHILIVPKRRIPTTNDLVASDAELIGKMILAAAEIAKGEGIAESGYRLVVNCNRDGGQSVDHIHCHLLGGRQLNWPPG